MINNEIKEKIEKLFSCYRISYRKFLTADDAFHVTLTDPITCKSQKCELFLSTGGAVLSLPTNNGSLEILIDGRSK